MATPTYDLIDSVDISSSVSSVTLTNINQTYEHLILEVDSSAGNRSADLRFNSDSGSNYNLIRIKAEAATINASKAIQFADDRIKLQADYNTVNIFHYSKTDRYKSMLSRSSNDFKADEAYVYAHMWVNTNAITQIEIIGSGGNFAAGDTVKLYGLVG